MEKYFHRFSELFAQLGLPNDPAAIRQFITGHTPLGGEIRLEDAPFWSPSQAQFLRDAVCQDSNWAEAADQLNAALRQG